MGKIHWTCLHPCTGAPHQRHNLPACWHVEHVSFHMPELRLHTVKVSQMYAVRDALRTEGKDKVHRQGSDFTSSAYHTQCTSNGG